MRKERLYLLLLVGMLIFSATFTAQNIEDKAQRIHRSVLTLDSHTDTPLLFGRAGYDFGKRNDPRHRGGKIDLPRMEEGSLDAVFFAVFVGQGPRTDQAHEAAKQRALDIFSRVHQVVASNLDKASLAFSPDDALRLKKEGKRAIFLGVENAYPIGNDLSNLHTFYKLGARYVTLSHTKNNDVCDSSTDIEEHGGLTAFGRTLVKEMNRLGMMVDVSHISDKAFYDVLAVSEAPVIASHSNARALCNNPRNLSDEMLLALKSNGGVIQVCILSAYVKKMPANPERDAAMRAWREKYSNFESLPEETAAIARNEWVEIDRNHPQEMATVADMVDHIDHIVKLIGIDHVGIGTDFDGGGGLADCYDVSELGNITLELVKRGYSQQQISKIWSGNFLRVFRQVEKLAGKKG